jgi:stage II sporulation protein P
LRRQTRNALLGLFLCAALTVVVMTDWTAVLSGGAVPVLAGAGAGAARTAPRFPFSVIMGTDARVPVGIMAGVIPLMGRTARPTSGDASPVALALAALTWVTGVDLTAPDLLLGSGIPIMRRVPPQLPFTEALPTTGAGAGGPSSPADPATNPPAPTVPGEPDRGVAPAPVIPVAKAQVGVYHTHARESFLPELPKVRRGNVEEAFSTDLDRTIVQAGVALVERLSAKYGIRATQVRTIHDGEGTLGAYTRSGQTAEKMLVDNSGMVLLLDLHRDAALRRDTTAKVNGTDMARVLLVVGTDRTLSHPNWKENYAFALRFTALMDKLYPGLSRGVMVKGERYNQHLLPQALLIEIGGPENSLAEVKKTAACLAEVIAQLLGATGNR